MEKKQATHTCARCGNRFDPAQTWRCPRCFQPAISAGGCTGACGKCKSGGCRK